MKRRQPTMTEKLASALLNLGCSDGEGGVTYLFTEEEREQLKGATAEQICSLFVYDHGVFHTWGGSMHPTNLTPLLIPANRVKTGRDIKIIRKADRVVEAQSKHLEKMAAKVGIVPDKQPDTPETKREWFESDSAVRKADNSKSRWGSRPMQSRQFQKGHRPMRGKAG